MAAPGDISFELERFEWATPDRLEVEGHWHGVRRRLPRATLVVEVDGERRRLRALADTSPDRERWIAAFPWEGEMPALPGAELEVGREIVVELPRPRRSKARPAAPVRPAAVVPGREEAERLLAVLTAARAEADEAAARAAAAEADAVEARERAEAAEAEVAPLRARAEAAEAELEPLRARAEAAEADLQSLRAGADAGEAERQSLRTRAEEAEAEVDAVRARPTAVEAELESRSGGANEADDERESLRARAQEAEAALAAARADDSASSTLERLRAELQTAERERMELRAQLDTTMERLEAAEEQARTSAPAAATERTQTMPGPRTAAAEAGAKSRFGRSAEDQAAHRPARRPAERTARRPDDTPEPAFGERISAWATSLTGARSGPQNGHTAKPPATARTSRARTARPGDAASTRRRVPPEKGQPSWVLRAAAIGLLALLMIALLVIVFSLL
jgi:predicted  nucleic acid-binding Zn-ribbon protein